MDREQIYERIVEVNSRYPDLHLEDVDPKLELIESNKVLHIKRIMHYWPDIEREAESVFIRNLLVPLHTFEDRPTDCTSVEFHYRYSGTNYEPSINVCWLQLLQGKRGKGLGNRLIENLDETARALEADTVYLERVTNPSFWTYKGYSEFRKLNHTNYWKRDQLIDLS